MHAHIKEQQLERERRHLPTLQHTMEVLWLPYLDELAREIGCRPNLGG